MLNFIFSKAVDKNKRKPQQKSVTEKSEQRG